MGAGRPGGGTRGPGPGSSPLAGRSTRCPWAAGHTCRPPPPESPGLLRVFNFPCLWRSPSLAESCAVTSRFSPHRGGRASSVLLCVHKGHRLHVLTPNPNSPGPQTTPRKQPVSPSCPGSDLSFAAHGLPAFGKTCNVPAQQRCKLARRGPCRPRGSG